MKIDFRPASPFPPEVIAANIAHARSLNRPEIGKGTGRLAVVGSGLSVQAYAETLRRWDGDIWAINGAYPWCRANGIDASFFSIDPGDSIAPHLVGSERAILALQCSPLAFATAPADATSVYDSAKFPGCSSSAGALFTAFDHGYGHVTFFGCDISFDAGRMHIGHSAEPIGTIVVRCGGCDYLTSPSYLVQALELAALLKAAPTCIAERSGGLFRALVENDDHDIVWCSPEVAGAIEPGVRATLDLAPEEKFADAGCATITLDGILIEEKAA